MFLLFHPIISYCQYSSHRWLHYTCLPYNFTHSLGKGKIEGFILFLKGISKKWMQSELAEIWNLLVDSIFCASNHCDSLDAHVHSTNCIMSSQINMLNRNQISYCQWSHFWDLVDQFQLSEFQKQFHSQMTWIIVAEPFQNSAETDRHQVMLNSLYLMKGNYTVL